MILTDFHSFTVNEDNFIISQFSRFLLRSKYAIQVKIWKWLKLLIFVPFIKKTLVSQVYIRIWSFWLTFTVLQWMKKNFKISQFSSFLLRFGYAIQVKIWKWLKLLNSVPFIKKTTCKPGLHLNLIILTYFHSFTVSEDKLQLNESIFKISSKVRVFESGQNLEMTKTSYFCSIHQENTCKSSLYSNLIILTDFHSFRVNQEKLHN